MKTGLARFSPFLAFVLLIFGVSGLLWSFLPAKTETTESILQIVRVPLSSADGTQNGVLMTPYTVVIESPTQLKQGGEADLRFSLVPTDIVVPLTATDNNIYETHNVMIELRPELGEITLDPIGSVSTAILEGQEISMIWQILSTQTGESEGTLWGYLEFYPLDGTEEVQRTAFIIKPLSFTTNHFIGLNTRWTAVLSAASLTAGVIIAIPLVSQTLQNNTIKKRKTNHG
jgi:hypothetical protein